MKKYSITLSTLLLVFCVIVFGYSNQVCAHKGQAQTLEGTVSSVQGGLKIKDAEGAEKTVPISSTTKVSKGGKEIKLSDIKVGDKIRVTVEDGSAKEIEVEE